MPYFAPDRLCVLASDAAFAGGEVYYAEGTVLLPPFGAEKVLAIIRGGEDYRFGLRNGGRRSAGDCTCPAFDRDG